MKNISLDLSKVKQTFGNTLTSVLHYHLVISILIIVGFLIFSVITVNAILSSTQDPVYTEQQQMTIIKTRFDDTTITKINELRSRQENPSLSLPDNGRRNPFRE